ncbi:hypothetical protein KUTeg_006935 [Tegillarca granosa]|uniref:Bcl-2 Bcl-2 homology region 1-3 domain-containing protein n=1 Tax=Tegillarca granosa TaxID=220873 RepID=A0ABQ9FET3_TEGGR|nr:hypothetical protein KUTeg_006935 [Tegillarca granosa]
MASWDGGTNTGRQSSSLPGDLRQISPNRDQQPLPPDTEENVCAQAEDVVKNFLFNRYRQDIQSDSDSGCETPAVPELMNFTSDPMSRASQVGRQLAMIGDDINRRYADEFSDMINQLHITEDTAYSVFANVAKKLFDGGINWGRVSALLCFAYRIAMTVLKVKERAKKFADFLRLIINYVVRFIKETIASWIARQGGWVSVMQYSPSMSLTALTFIVGSCLITIAAVFYFKKGSSS